MKYKTPSSPLLPAIPGAGASEVQMRKFFEDINSFLDDSVRRIRADIVKIVSGADVVDHGSLAGLADDDHCFSEDTELLTKSGFKYYDDISESDKALTFNMENDRLEYQNIQKIYIYDSFREMVSFKNRYGEILTTKKHRTIYKNTTNNKKNKSSKWFECTSEEALNKSVLTIPTGGLSDGKRYDISNKMLELLGIIISEGHFINPKLGGYGVQLYQKPGEQSEYIESVLIDVGAPYTKMTRQTDIYYIRSQWAKNNIRNWIDRKDISEKLMNLRGEQFLWFLSGLILGDGSVRSKGKENKIIALKKLRNNFDKKIRYSYHSSDKSLVDNLCHLCTLNGLSAYSYYRNGGFKNGCWSINIKNSKETLFKKGSKSIISYGGKAWCASVKNKTLVLRRNGFIFISGNTQYHNNTRGDLRYSALGHNHDSAYSAIGHNHDGTYSILGHNHDLSYAAIAHNHDLLYAAIGHNHDSAYSAIGHDHDSDYSAIGHDHDSDYIQKSIITQQGDIVCGSGASTPAVLSHGNVTDLLASGGHAANPYWMPSDTFSLAGHSHTSDNIDISLLGTPLSLSGIVDGCVAGLNETDVAFIDSNNDQLRLYRWGGSSWSLIGSALSLTVGTPAVCALSSSTVAVVIYESSVYKLAKYSWGGSSWSLVGNKTELTSFGNSSTKLTALDDSTVVLFDNEEIKVYSFDGSDWSKEGNTLVVAGANGAVCALNSEDIAFTNNQIDELRTYRWDGSDFTLVGSALTVSIGVPSLSKINSSDVVLVDGSSDVIHAYRWSGVAWSSISSDKAVSNLSFPSVSCMGDTGFALVDTYNDTLSYYSIGYDLNFLNGAGTFGRVTESSISTSDVTTLNVSTSKHGFAPKNWMSAWTEFTPDWAGITEGSGSNYGWYLQIGKLVIFQAYWVFGTSASVTGAVTLTLPVTINNRNNNIPIGNVVMLDSSTSRQIPGFITSDGSVMYEGSVSGVDNRTERKAVSSSSPFTWATDDTIAIFGMYEAS